MSLTSATPVVYVDTSAVLKLLSAEAESDAVRAFLDTEPGPALVSSALLETELRRIGIRHGIDQVLFSAVLDGVTLTALERVHYRDAGRYPQSDLRSLDALHLAGALSVDADAILTYDERLASAAKSHGLSVIAPT